MPLDDHTACESVCYVHCNFCTTSLAVNIPCNVMANAVTVKCGHCSNLWSLNLSDSNMLKPTGHRHHAENFQKQSLLHQDLRENSPSFKCSKVAAWPKPLSVNAAAAAMGKRQRPPSAYNRFIKEEIRRIKTNNPNISHREAFSTAAKNWAHLPHALAP